MIITDEELQDLIDGKLDRSGYARSSRRPSPPTGRHA
jgi:hypothetical protein